MIPDLLKDAEEKMKKAVEATQQEFAQIRTGRANPGLVEHIKVDVYGSTLPINQLAAVTVPEPRQLLITPYDKNVIAAIEKTLMKSDLGMTPNSDGLSIRLNIPQLNEQRRKDLTKQVNQKAEHGRVSIRTVRQEVQKKLQQAKKSSEISEDDERRAMDSLQKLVDRYIVQVDDITKVKDAELLEV